VKSGSRRFETMKGLKKVRHRDDRIVTDFERHRIERDQKMIIRGSVKSTKGAHRAKHCIFLFGATRVSRFRVSRSRRATRVMQVPQPGAGGTVFEYLT